MYEIKNYTKEYYINHKLIGTIILEKPDREKLGYPGKRLEVLPEDIKFCLYLSNLYIIKILFLS